VSSQILRTPLPAPPLPSGRPRLVLAGFMGTGKSEAGRRAALALSLPFVDLDEVLERRLEMPVGAIFARHGEVGFREAERKAMADAARLSGTVIAVGGGAVLSRDAFARLAQGAAVVTLTCDPEVILLRVKEGPDRPLLQPDPPARIMALMRERAEAYRSLGDPLDTTTLDPAQAGVLVAARYSAPFGGLIRIEVAGADGLYPVMIGNGAIGMAGEEMARILPRATRAAIVTDDSIPAALAARVSRSLEGAGLSITPAIVVPPGERAKSLDTAAMVWRRFQDEGLEPSDVVVAVGGGATLDVVGFAAATFARGVALVNIPTTLLAMVDASLGGKVGIDHDGIKNKLGSFHHPALVVADPSTLGTLPPRFLRAGLSEIIKAGILASPLLLDVLEELPLTDGMPPHLTWIIEQSVRIKAAYVAADPRDGELRHSLNLGHTFAHAIEAASGYEVLHGEAVAIGLVAAARLGARAGVTDPALEGRIERLMSRLGLPARPDIELDRGRVLSAMSSDKKRRSGRDVFVLPAQGGGAELLEGDLAEEALEALLPHVMEGSAQ